jgi:ABC-type Zn uptake system ZnuABC Zn-binding protein ZnuA
MREITLTNKKLEKLLTDRAPLVEEGRRLQDEMEAMKKEFNLKIEAQNKVAKQINKIKDKIIPILQKEVNHQLEEFEDTREAEIRDGVIIVTVGNHLEEWKERFLEKKKQSRLNK